MTHIINKEQCQMNSIYKKRLPALVIAALIILALFPIPSANAAVKPEMKFDCAYSGTGNTLTVTAKLVNPDNDINSGMFVLKYDKSLLSTDTTKITPASSNINIPDKTKYLDTDKGYAGADWFPNSTIKASSAETPIAQIVFNVASGKTKSDLESANAISVCTDTAYLDGLGGYGSTSGGVMLCSDSTHTYGTKDSTASASVSYRTDNTTVTTPEAKPNIHFHGVLSEDKKTYTVTASVYNPVSKTASAMFVLKYDSTKLSTSKSKVTYLGEALESKTYCTESPSGTSGSSVTSSNAKYVGADWFYNTALSPSSAEIPAVKVEFDVKNNASLDDLKNAVGVCDDESYLKSINYKDDGGILICETGDKFYNAKQSSATASFTQEQETKKEPKPNIHFHGVYDKTKKTLTVTASISNPDNKVSSAMFVLKYDSTKLSTSKSKVSYLGNAVESKTYCNEGSSGASPQKKADMLPSGSSVTSSNEKFVGADWYYNTPLAASSTETPAVKIDFDVKNNATYDEVKNALAVCDNDAYLKSLTYGDDGGLLICEDGDIFYNAKKSTATASFTFEETSTTTTSSTTTTTTTVPPMTTIPQITNTVPQYTSTVPGPSPVKSGDPEQSRYPYVIRVLIASAIVAFVSGMSLLYYKYRMASVRQVKGKEASKDE